MSEARSALQGTTLSLAGASTSIIFVATKLLSQQIFVATNIILSRQKNACRDKTFVVTNTCSDDIKQHYPYLGTVCSSLGVIFIIGWSFTVWWSFIVGLFLHQQRDLSPSWSLIIGLVSHRRTGLSLSRWSFITRISHQRVVSRHRAGLLSWWWFPMGIVSHHGLSSSGWSFIIVLVSAGLSSSGWSFIKGLVCHHGAGLSSSG